MRLSVHLPTFLAVAYLAVTSFVPGAALAADASVCTSLCTGARQSCRAKVPRAVNFDRTPLIESEEKNRLAAAAGQGQPVPPDTRRRERSEDESRRIERNGICDDDYHRCVRSCASPAAAAGTSEVLTPQGRARPSGK
jgi:hypothetical protein